MANRTSDAAGQPRDPSNGVVKRQPGRVEPSAFEDEQTLADLDQTLQDGDQTLSDADQTASDHDRTSADQDQLAADRDQVASDRDLASGGDRLVHDLSMQTRGRTTLEREQADRLRERSARARLDAADTRDTIAGARDAAARARDLAARGRQIAMTQLDASAQQADETRAVTGIDVVMRASRQRKGAAQRRAQASEQRELAAADRVLAAEDRQHAAGERLQAFSDREALLSELEDEQDRREQALRYQHRAEELARTLQRSLSPPTLPRVAGLDVAVHYQPAAPEDVGGDFYDLFPLGGLRMGCFLGDVCGKGPQAAAVTSRARYTMRTAAMLHETPGAILMDLNEALLMQSSEPIHTCTAVYGEIAMRAQTTSVTLAVAGHPAPLIVRASGVVETTPARGSMLGAVIDPVFHPCEIELAPGDALVMCSDGIFDTEIDAIRVDEEHLAVLLSGPPNADAQAIVDRLTHELRTNERPLRDDVAIMVLRRTPPSSGCSPAPAAQL